MNKFIFKLEAAKCAWKERLGLAVNVLLCIVQSGCQNKPKMAVIAGIGAQHGLCLTTNVSVFPEHFNFHR
jgi:hypothetical protein